MPINDERKVYLKEYRKEYKTRVKRVEVWFTNEEYDQLKAVADHEGIKVSQLIAEEMQGFITDTQRIPKPIQDEKQEIRFLLRNMANNISQVSQYSPTLKAMIDQGLLLRVKAMEDLIENFTEERVRQERGKPRKSE